ncbi:PREDICTED: uncharacterized protein LOC104736055 [Camelina sativa]|uniref:Uncharacterized protein LOC104736055 n=1 Tax=Camelina sativa TaxID=90675 RepID=A0ABM0VCW8_CAMSA|nr:PREDICTED: uncharacterized protein LOC104736055 [Camelina sativa]
MAQMCHTCRRRPAEIHCFTEATNLCIACDCMRHRGPDAGHIRYQLCEKCWVNPGLLICFDHKIVLCQSCYSLRYNCVPDGHRYEIVNLVPLHLNNPYHEHQHQHQHHEREHMLPHVVHLQRREGMFEMSCNGHNNCERWMFAMKCESCVASNAVVYCPQHDHLLCDNCDRVIHFTNHQGRAVTPHMRFVLCVSCKRLSRNFLIEDSCFSLSPTHPPALSSTGPGQ